MADRKKYAPLTKVQRLLTEGDTAILECGAIVSDVTRISQGGRYWVGQIASGEMAGWTECSGTLVTRTEGQAGMFCQDTVADVTSAE